VHRDGGAILSLLMVAEITREQQNNEIDLIRTFLDVDASKVDKG